MSERPVFVAGPGRSGTTLLVRLLSLHPDLAWFSGWSARFPSRPAVALLHRLNDWPTLERRARGWPKWPRAAEAYDCWDWCFPGFSSARSDWGREKADPEGAERLRRIVAGHERWHGKPRFMTKYTGWPRIDFLRAIFPDPRVVWIDRDPRAVALSYLKQWWWFKNRPEALAAMTMDERIDFYAERYLEFWRARRRFRAGPDYLLVRYEDLVADPVSEMERVCRDVGLPWSGSLARSVQTYEVVRGANRAAADRHTGTEWAALGERLAEPLAELGC